MKMCQDLFNEIYKLPSDLILIMPVPAILVAADDGVAVANVLGAAKPQPAGAEMPGVKQFTPPWLWPKQSQAVGDTFLREALYKLRVVHLHDRTVKLHPVRVTDLAVKGTEAVARSGEHGKLTANWEDPSKVVEQVRPGPYGFITPQGIPIPRT
ncbi:hypothetical protein Cgig2_030502 [Carnegiea gigantea]|uniref:Uncharacterized protein n=1 Tax=Carnegiea gigantea TaxID=171969 RepID=A0A9Q1GH57_9CARY|nr:hypothetical protein Cgig2_030502 [Carnegiea gigantea]